MKIWLLSLFSTLIALMLVPRFAYAMEYKVYDLVPAGAYSAQKKCINNSGEVVAFYTLSNDTKGYFIYNPITQVCSNSVDIQNGDGICVNDQRQVLLQVSPTPNVPGSYPYRSAIWTPINNQIMLLPPDGEYSILPAYMNNSGNVTGTLNSTRSPIFWSAFDGLINLGFQGSASAINDHDQIIGDWRVSDAAGYSTFIWSRDTGMVDIGHFGRYSVATGINNHGQVAGSVILDNGLHGVFMWDSINGYKLIYNSGKPQPGDAHVSINDNGALSFYWGDNISYTWDEVNGVQSYEAQAIYDINNAGMMAVKTIDGHNVLWVPVPEPSSILALLCGVVGSGAFLWRRRR